MVSLELLVCKIQEYLCRVVPYVSCLPVEGLIVKELKKLARESADALDLNTVACCL